MFIPNNTDVAGACTFWQAGRNGSSLLRAGARVISGIPHYFCADFIHAYEEEARRNPQALAQASVLLNELATSEQRSPSQWAAHCEVVDRDFAGRGLKANPEKDDQIERRLQAGSIEMPLWGVSLDPAVAHHYGSRFLLEMVEGFPAIPAWRLSSTKTEEQELITGGTYKVLSIERSRGATHARLRWTEPCQPRLLCEQSHDISTQPHASLPPEMETTT